MAVLTCTEMVDQCLRGQKSGWRHFITEYLPFASRLIDRHSPSLAGRCEALLREVVLRTRDEDARFFREYRGQSEREFLLHSREHVLNILEEAEPEVPLPEVPLDWEVFTKALSGLSVLECQVVWLYLLSPINEDSGVILRMDQATVLATMSKVQELLRTNTERWSAATLAENRHLLIQAARTHQTKECPDAKLFLRMLDGQITWRDRLDLEGHLAGCWYCVDRLCRFREVSYLSHRRQPFSDVEAEPYIKAMGLDLSRPSRWKRLLGGRT